MAFGDTVTMVELETDPDPILARMRAEEPVCWVPALEMWLVTRWDDIAHVEAHPELFTAATEPSFLARALGPSLLTTDPPEHTRLHGLLAPPFRAGGRSGRFATDELVPLADQLLDHLDDPGDFDVMADYAQPLAAGSLATVLGLDEHGFEQMWEWCAGLCADIANFTNDPELTARGDRTKAELGRALADRVERVRARPDDSAVSMFVANGATLDEIVNNVRLMISGGINEPRDGIGLVTATLLRDPSLRSRVSVDPGAWRRLVEEVFRVHSPVGTITRQATAPLALAGAAIPGGDLVAGVLRSANLDEAHWTDPGRIDLDRREGPHAAFALGVHRCLGEWLGRQVVKVGTQRLFERLPNLRLAPGADIELHGFEFRGPRTVAVRAD